MVGPPALNSALYRVEGPEKQVIILSLELSSFYAETALETIGGPTTISTILCILWSYIITQNQNYQYLGFAKLLIII